MTSGLNTRPTDEELARTNYWTKHTAPNTAGDLRRLISGDVQPCMCDSCRRDRRKQWRVGRNRAWLLRVLVLSVVVAVIFVLFLN